MLRCYEPDVGLDTTRLKTRADWNGHENVVNGRKMWTFVAQTSSKILLIVRTTPLEETRKPIDGLSLFYTDLEKSAVEAIGIGRHALNRTVEYAKERMVFGRHFAHTLAASGATVIATGREMGAQPDGARTVPWHWSRATISITSHYQVC